MLINWRINEKHVLIVGGGAVATDRVCSLLASDAKVTLMSPTLTKPLQAMRDEGKFEYIAKAYSGERDLQRTVSDVGSSESTICKQLNQANLEEGTTGKSQLYAMVLTAIDDRETSEQIYHHCKKLGIPVNCADIPALCDFYFGSMIRRPDLEVMVSTNGAGPGMARKIRMMLEEHMDNDNDLKHASDAINAIAKLRSRLRKRLVESGARDDDPKVIRSRMGWVSKLCSSTPFEELSALDDTAIDKMIDQYMEDR